MFLRRLISLCTKVKCLHHHISINNSARADIQWWVHNIPHFNRKSIIPTSFIHTSQDIKLFTDASIFRICYTPRQRVDTIIMAGYISCTLHRFQRTIRDLCSLRHMGFQMVGKNNLFLHQQQAYHRNMGFRVHLV